MYANVLHGPHMLIGVAAGYGVAVVLGLPGPPLAYAAIAGFTAPLPDIDQHWAHGLPANGAPAGLFEHRGPTHSLLFAFLLGYAAYRAGGYFGIPWVGYAAAIGVVSHLLADGISYMGVPYLWPLIRQRLRLLPHGFRLHSGSFWEYPIALLAVLGVIGLTARTAHADGPNVEATQRAINNLANDVAQGTTTYTPTITPTPTVTPTATATLTATPTLTPTTEPTATPAPTPCYMQDEEGWDILDDDQNPIPCPTDTVPAVDEIPVPTDTPGPTETPTPTQPGTPVVIIIHDPAPEPATQYVIVTATPTLTAAPTATTGPTATPHPATYTPTATPTATATATRTATVQTTPTPVHPAPTPAVPPAPPVPGPVDPPAPITPELPSPYGLAGIWLSLAFVKETLPWVPAYLS